jgi:hypothetical protein
MQQTNPAISVAGMAALVGLSRDRFYDLIRSGIFPPPIYRIDTRRPFYSPELQEICLSVRRTGRGFNGALVLFNQTAPSKKLRVWRTRARAAGNRDAGNRDLASKLHYLGLLNVTPELVAAALHECRQGDGDDLDEPELLRKLVRQFAEKSQR